jgi:ketosteroid isomerase-like protein
LDVRGERTATLERDDTMYGMSDAADRYAIAVAKTEYREAYNTADVNRLLSVFSPSFVDCSDGHPTFYGPEAAAALRLRLDDLFRDFAVEIQVVMVEIAVMGDFAYDWGWHKVRLTDKSTGEQTDTRYRYFETWKKENGDWKITYLMDNREHPARMLPEAGEASLRRAGTTGKN